MLKTKNLFIACILVIIVSGCSLNKPGYIQPNENNLKQIKNAYIKDNIELRLINEYNEIFKLEDVIVNYGKTPFEPMKKTLDEVLISTNKDFNKTNIQYSKNGIEESILGVPYAQYTDEALLSILAKEYGMDILVFDTDTNTAYKIDLQNSNIILTKELRHNIYNGFVDTAQYYEDRENDK